MVTGEPILFIVHCRTTKQNVLADRLRRCQALFTNIIGVFKMLEMKKKRQRKWLLGRSGKARPIRLAGQDWMPTLASVTTEHNTHAWYMNTNRKVTFYWKSKYRYIVIRKEGICSDDPIVFIITIERQELFLLIWLQAHIFFIFHRMLGGQYIKVGVYMGDHPTWHIPK